MLTLSGLTPDSSDREFDRNTEEQQRTAVNSTKQRQGVCQAVSGCASWLQHTPCKGRATFYCDTPVTEPDNAVIV